MMTWVMQIKVLNIGLSFFDSAGPESAYVGPNSVYEGKVIFFIYIEIIYSIHKNTHIFNSHKVPFHIKTIVGTTS